MEKAQTLTVSSGSIDPLAENLAARARARYARDTRVFDRLTRLVSSLLDVPVSLLLIRDEDQLVFVSHVGLEETWGTIEEFPLADAYCQFAIGACAPFVVEDARTNPLVSGLRPTTELGAVAYLGVPLLTSSGTPVGLLCAIDFKPRAWSKRDIGVVEDLSATVMAYLEENPTAGGRPAANGHAAPGLNIAAVSRKTGIAPDTLRKWERRYGILRPKRTPGGQRRYDDSDVARVEWLRDRLADGFRISEAAALLDSAGADAHTSVDDLRDALVEAARAADPARLSVLVEQVFALQPVSDAIETIVQPALERIGSEWAERGGAIAEEHLVTEMVRARLERMLADRRPGIRGSAVLACGPGERHELGLLALAVMLQADGWLVAYLGADTPTASIAELAATFNADVLCLSLSSTAAHERVTTELAELTLPESLRVILGGSAAPDAPGLAATVVALRT
ncbi:MAG: MerR family transcriptional regulator [Actinobacteria bacterium]|nr:MerR family transcriptional regulator [Actinomycetota bacterium]